MFLHVPLPENSVHSVGELVQEVRCPLPNLTAENKELFRVCKRLAEPHMSSHLVVHSKGVPLGRGCDAAHNLQLGTGSHCVKWH